MTDFPTVEQAGMLMIMMIVFGVVLALIVAPQVDQIITTMRGMGFDAGAQTPWSDETEFWAAHNIFLLFIYCPGPMGIIIFLISCARRNRRDNVADVSGYEAGNLYYSEE